MLKKIIKVESVDSSNNYALDLIKKSKVVEGTVVWAFEQTKGRGQRDNYWESEKGKNLTFSIILFPEFLEVEQQFLLSKAVSLGIVDFIKTYVENVSIKWANDIYVNDKKIAGTLIENSIIGNKILSSVVGIGLNINQTIFISNAPNPVSLKLITGNDYDLEESLSLLCNFIESRYLQLKANELSQLNYDYLNTLYRYNAFYTYESDGKRFIAKITGIAKSGRLILETRQGEIKEFDFNEVLFVI